MQDKISTHENAKAIKYCLDYLAREARESGMKEVAQLIDLAALAAEDVAGPVH